MEELLVMHGHSEDPRLPDLDVATCRKATNTSENSTMAMVGPQPSRAQHIAASEPTSQPQALNGLNALPHGKRYPCQRAIMYFTNQPSSNLELAKASLICCASFKQHSIWRPSACSEHAYLSPKIPHAVAGTPGLFMHCRH